jgi:hypothetical protein
MIQVRASEVVSEPAKKKVLTFASSSLSVTLCSEGVLVDKLDLTEEISVGLKKKIHASTYSIDSTNQCRRTQIHSSLLRPHAPSFL